MTPDMSDIVDRLRATSIGLCAENPAHYSAGRLTVADAIEAADGITTLRAKLDLAETHIEELSMKVKAPNCACSYDYPGDVCVAHSPAVQALRAKLEKAKEALKPFADAVIERDANAAESGYAPSFDEYVARWDFPFGTFRRAATTLKEIDT